MEGEAVAAILQVLVQNLIDHTKSEISLIEGLDNDAAKLAASLDTIQKFLNDAEVRTILGDAVKSWLKKLEDVAFDADNVLDELNYHLLSKQINPIKPIKPLKEKVLSCFFSPCDHIASRRKMALRIREINENLESINKEATDLGLVGRLADAPTFVAASTETDSFTDDPVFIGRDDVVSELVNILETTNDKISILAIVGMGGLGKTTLTRKLFHHETMKAKFGSHIWVHVSQIFDPITLFKKILKELKPDQVEVESRQDILKNLLEALKDKSYLLVLDDVWNEDFPIWEDFISSISGVTSTKGSGAIVVTTRSMKVASTVNPIYTRQLSGLSDEHCWSIIKTKSFGNKDCPSNYEAIGRNIAKRCRGLPLAANVVGGLLCNSEEKNWLSIEEKWLSHDEGDNIRQILRLSFDNLSPPSLKKCFAYCSIFPKGEEIRKQALIEYWMAEGFLQDDGSSDMESSGDKFINILVQNSLLQVVERDGYGDTEVCQMHDLVHDLATSVLTSSNDVDGTKRVRYMTHQDQSSPITKEVAKYLRTLVLEGEISDNMLSDLECVHVLAFGGQEVKELPSSIRKMIHLRNLDVSETRIEHMPNWIGELFHLQTLRIDTKTLKKLPCTIKYLVNLRNLCINDDVELPAGIGRLTSLRTLTHFTVGHNNGCKVEELGSLDNLTGKLKIKRLERVGNKEEADRANLCKKSKIRELWLTLDTDREGEIRNDENVLEGLQPHPNLNELFIEGFEGRIFPTWSEKMAVRDGPRGTWEPLNKLIKITLSNCQECEEIPMLGHLPSLRSLYLGRLSNVTRIKSSFYGLVNKERPTFFPALKYLYLVEMPKLVEWKEVELAGASEVKNVFPQLQHLEIDGCKQLMSAPTHFSSSLNHLKFMGGIGSYMTLARISLKLTSLTSLRLDEVKGLERLPDWLFVNNPNLSKLVINDFRNLREFPNGLCTLRYLEKLMVRGCPNLEQLGDSGEEESLGSLRSLHIRSCPALVYLPCEMVGSSLEELRLEHLSSLMNLPMLIDCLTKSPRLTELVIEDVPNFKATCHVEKWPFRSLRVMAVDASIGGSMETVDSMLQACHSLEHLSLKGMNCELPESIQHLTTLSVLWLENFGMEKLPEWFGHFSSLNDLGLVNCKELRRQPSLDAMRRLTRLQTLFVTGCPKYHIDEQQSGMAQDFPYSHHLD